MYDEKYTSTVNTATTVYCVHLTDVQCNIAFGMLPGHKTTTCDAVQAYIQSELKSKDPTWVVIPPELQPPSWRGKYKKPCCRLLRSLYGHPEAGAHWQKHLHDVLVNIMGAVPIPTHLSSYMLPNGLHLTVYVDDLMISGPAQLHS